jgi:hypothetical protein
MVAEENSEYIANSKLFFILAFLPFHCHNLELSSHEPQLTYSFPASVLFCLFNCTTSPYTFTRATSIDGIRNAPVQNRALHIHKGRVAAIAYCYQRKVHNPTTNHHHGCFRQDHYFRLN